MRKSEKARKYGVSPNKAAPMLALAVLLAGCAQSGNNPPEGSKENEENQMTKEPIELVVLSRLSEAMFKDSLADPVRKKYPNVTLKQLSFTGKLDELISSNVPIDILDSNTVTIYDSSRMKLAEDLTPYMKRFSVNLSALDERILEAVNKTYYFEGKLLALPITVGVASLHYNKDLFDKFGVPYPKDGMTWEEVREIAKKMTRKEGGVQYRGIELHLDSTMVRNQLSLPVVDQKTKQAAVTTAGWERWFDTMKSLYEIEGNIPERDKWGTGTPTFLKDRTIAMYAIATMFGPLPDAVKAGLNWDVVTLPSFSDIPNTTIQPWMPSLAVSTQSKHKDEAFQVIAFIFSEEGQLANTKIGRPSVLKNPEINKHFGESIEVLRGKNAAAYRKNKLAVVSPSNTEYDDVAYSILKDKFREFVYGDKDRNTALREAEEAINKKIAEALQK